MLTTRLLSTVVLYLLAVVQCSVLWLSTGFLWVMQKCNRSGNLIGRGKCKITRNCSLLGWKCVSNWTDNRCFAKLQTVSEVHGCQDLLKMWMYRRCAGKMSRLFVVMLHMMCWNVWRYGSGNVVRLTGKVREFGFGRTAYAWSHVALTVCQLCLYSVIVKLQWM